MFNRKTISKGFGILLLSMFSITNANIDHFDIIANPSSAKVGEALDITIKALDKDNNIVENYEGSILVFSESDPDAEYPGVLAENTYTFKASDEGNVKFENAVKFLTEGTHDISVYDFNNEDIYGLTNIEITNTSSQSETKDIFITSPDNGVTIGENKVTVSGTTEKNHKVQIIVNTENKYETQSNSEGFFEQVVTDLPDNSDTIIKAIILDADDNNIGESSEVKVTIENSSPRLDSILLTKEEVDTQEVIGVELISNKGLKSVELIINDTIVTLEESSEGKYTGNITAPDQAGSYKIDSILKDDLGHKTEEKGVKTLKVNQAEVIEEVIKDTTEENVELESAPEEEVELSLEEKLQIKGLKLTKLKTKSILSWDKNELAEEYKVYKKDSNTGEMNLIETVNEPRIIIHITGDKVIYEDFTVKGIAKNLEGIEVEASDYSQMTKVQTGPTEILLVLLSMLLGIFIINRKKA